ncbi:MAG: sigma-70 family RNA polymerase sigma factor [Crocinitomicaceae bacterium]|nr:sigma-70 family RNA polymerase sigma factor [Crocinitomicaceae bacterium]
MTAFEFNTRVIDLNDFITGFALKYTRDEDLAKDLAQETILKALSNREKFTTNTNLKGWLKVILKNTFINSYRKKSNQVISYNSDDYKVMVGDMDDYKPDDMLMTDHIQSLIDELPEFLQTPFMMHVDGFKYHEIAEQLDLPLGTVKSRIHQTRKVLSNQISHD